MYSYTQWTTFVMSSGSEDGRVNDGDPVLVQIVFLSGIKRIYAKFCSGILPRPTLFPPTLSHFR